MSICFGKGNHYSPTNVLDRPGLAFEVGDKFEVVGQRFAQDYVIGFMVGDDVARVVNRAGQSAFANDEGCAVRLLVGEEPGPWPWRR